MTDRKDLAWDTLMEAARKAVGARGGGAGHTSEALRLLLAAGQRAALLAVAAALEEAGDAGAEGEAPVNGAGL